ncbi:germination protein YpeB [Jeotgalibacillus soli]|uniref:Sporulation protein n=1 Tax=Jeotgalibacillus soli TaxID=889306 RepID=A0A0C2R1N3_9BACL|nr:germination protein YpeB [Jeotgalibacillus soli]KIL44220.1 hypothetical protein KP78_31840 [Jeotgalibacillus soli]
MKKTLLFSVLFFGLFSAVAWGAYQKTEKDMLRTHVENQYQRAFHELTYQMDLLHDQIGSTLAMNTGASLTPTLTDVWRLTSNIHSDIGQLPLGMLPFNEMESFLTKIGEFSYRVAVRDLKASPLSDEEYSKLESLYAQSAELQNELRDIQSTVLEEQLEWVGVEKLMATNDEVKDNSLIDGLKTVDSSIKGYTEASFVMSDQETAQKRREQLSHLKGKEINEQEAIEKIKEFTGSLPANGVEVSESLKGANYPFYSVYWENEQGHRATMDVTKIGGYPLYYMVNRDVKDSTISLYKAGEKATEYLKEKGYKDIVLDTSRQVDHVALLTFVRVLEPDQIYVMSDSIQLKVALDNGEIIGFLGMDYLQNGEKRHTSPPTLSEEAAIEMVHSKFEIQETRLALIRNELQDEVLCYEFIGNLGDDTFRIYVNADSGQEEKIEKL